MARRQPVTVLVPHECALAYDGRSWKLLPAPPAWWLEEQEELHSREELPALSLVPPLPRRTTACRPGSGPCARRHEHASRRRAG
jgi:hypothetical protein